MREFSIQELLKYTSGILMAKEVEKVNLDTKIREIVIDSRKARMGALFVAIVGERNDAHNFIPQVYEAGCRVCFISKKDIPLLPDMIYILVEHTVWAMQEVAYHYRKELTLPLIGITGSVGKTTTREMVALALSVDKKVFQTAANFNSQIGVPLTLLSIDSDFEIGVIELGISEFGEMSRIARLVQPDVAVITNIGTAHIEQLKTSENICNEKLKIQEGMKGNILFLNIEDKILAKAKPEEGIQISYFGNGEHSMAFARDIQMIDGCANFYAVIQGEEVRVTLKVHGKHQILNTLIALSIAKYYGVELSKASEKLSEFYGFAHRQQIFYKNGMRIIDDTYNASPTSMKSAIDILLEMPGRKIAVLGDMKELGEKERELHREIGEYLKGAEMYLITLGTLAEEIANVYQSQGKIAYKFMDREKMEEFLEQFLQSGDSVLYKGSNSMRLMESVKKILGND